MKSKFSSYLKNDFFYSAADYDECTGKDKTMCVVDSGIAFNSPFPAVIRPERNIELILSFDFSQRDGGDKELPFGVSVFFLDYLIYSGSTFTPGKLKNCLTNVGIEPMTLEG